LLSLSLPTPLGGRRDKKERKGEGFTTDRKKEKKGGGRGKKKKKEKGDTCSLSHGAWPSWLGGPGPNTRGAAEDQLKRPMGTYKTNWGKEKRVSVLLSEGGKKKAPKVEKLFGEKKEGTA